MCVLCACSIHVCIHVHVSCVCLHSHVLCDAYTYCNLGGYAIIKFWTANGYCLLPPSSEAAPRDKVLVACFDSVCRLLLLLASQLSGQGEGQGEEGEEEELGEPGRQSTLALLFVVCCHGTTTMVVTALLSLTPCDAHTHIHVRILCRDASCGTGG